MDINLNLTIEEINFILGILAERPYNEVADLIMKISNQGNNQIESTDKTTEAI
jgi:hypothetical protein